MEYLTEKEIFNLLEDNIKLYGSQRSFCKASHISTSYLNNVLERRDKLGPSILRVLGLERVVLYRKI
jgi:hypothetical protein